MVNARAETVAEKRSFREAFQKRRCLILADGFYEWQKRDGKKQPYCMQMKDDQPFAFNCSRHVPPTTKFSATLSWCSLEALVCVLFLKCLLPSMPAENAGGFEFLVLSTSPVAVD